MIVIVEGVDRVGKTTLVNMLVKEGFKLVKSKKPPFINASRKSETEQAIISGIMAVLEVCKYEDIVIDRFHASELVYGFIERGEYRLNVINGGHAAPVRMEEFLYTDDALAKLGAVIAYVRPTNVVSSGIEHGRSLIDHSAMFEQLMAKSTKCTVISGIVTGKQKLFQIGRAHV